MDTLSRLDLAFCIDLTSSMSSFIQAARQRMESILDELQKPLGEGLRVAVVGYHDHCDKQLLEVAGFERSIPTIRKTLNGLKVNGGGDGPEAVYSGLHACLELPWEPGAYRVVVLVGDAPPHACGGNGDSYPKQDPSGYDLDQMANTLETEGVFVHALAMTHGSDQVLERSFKRLSLSTGGSYSDAKDATGAMSVVQTITVRFLQDLDLDRRVKEAVERGVVERLQKASPVAEGEEPPGRAEVLSKHLERPVQDIYGALMRLRQRRLLES